MGQSLVADAGRFARCFQRSTNEQIEYWVRLGRALEASPAFSNANVNAALAGAMIESLNALEQIAYLERVPEVFDTSSLALVTAYADLSENSQTDTDPAP